MEEHEIKAFVKIKNEQKLLPKKRNKSLNSMKSKLGGRTYLQKIQCCKQRFYILL
jgi:uncharacterized protein YwqG